MPSHSTLHDELECAPTQQQQQEVRRRTKGHFTV